MKQKLIFFTIIYIINLMVFFFINTGFASDYQWENLQTLILATAFSLCLFWHSLRRYILLLAVFFIFLMVILYTVNLMNLSNAFGSTAFGLVMLVLVSYLPKLIQNGYI